MTEVETLTSTQRGKIAELLVATALMAQSDGRLSPFEPLSDDHGIDLVVLDKQSGAALPIQVKSWFLSRVKKPKTVQFDVQKTTFSGGNSGALICVVIDPDTMSFHTSWIIPNLAIPQVATERPTKFALSPSILKTSKDRYTPYRNCDLHTFAQRVAELLV